MTPQAACLIFNHWDKKKSKQTKEVALDYWLPKLNYPNELSPIPNPIPSVLIAIKWFAPKVIFEILWLLIPKNSVRGAFSS